MTYFLNYRRKLWFILLFFLVVFTFAAASTGYWIFYAVVTSMFGVLFLCDILFLGEQTFIFDPSLASWAIRSGAGSADY